MELECLWIKVNTHTDCVIFAVYAACFCSAPSQNRSHRRKKGTRQLLCTTAYAIGTANVRWHSAVWLFWRQNKWEAVRICSQYMYSLQCFRWCKNYDHSIIMSHIICEVNLPTQLCANIVFAIDRFFCYCNFNMEKYWYQFQRYGLTFILFFYCRNALMICV